MKQMLTAGYISKGLNKEFSKYKESILATEKILQAYVFWQKINEDGTWLTPEQIKSEASFLLQRMIETHLIQNDGMIVNGILECINETIRN